MTSQLVLYMSELNLTDEYQSRTLYFCETSEGIGGYLASDYSKLLTTQRKL